MAVKTRELVDLDLIDDNPWQPRREIEPEPLRELAEDIRVNGLLQTPLARPAVDGRYELAFGHRRVAAVRLLHQQGEWDDGRIEIDVEDLTDERMVVIALSENVQRRQLTDIEVVRAHQRAVTDTGMTIQSLADKLGLDRSTVSNNLRVLALPDFVLEHVESGECSMAAAREFLALQHESHAHLDDMREIVSTITRVWGTRGKPDWTQRHVRERIYFQVAADRQGEAKWRPLERVPAAGATGEARLEPNFDTEAFKRDYPAQLHIIPAVSKTEIIRFQEQIYCGASRLWTCEVKEWSRRKAAATREANKADPETQAVQQVRREGKQENDEASQLGEYLAKDPVWKAIAAKRDKKGPFRPVTDEERKALGTRASVKDRTSYNSRDFWKRLEKAAPSDSPRLWTTGDGGPVPPHFPLEGCAGCVKGAAYVRPGPGGHTGKKLVLCCTNKSCYGKRLAEGEAAIRPRIEDEKAAIARHDGEAIRALVDNLEFMDTASVRALATVLMANIEKFEMLHPFGEYVEAWSYESSAVARVREILGIKSAYYTESGRYHSANGRHYLTDSRREEYLEALANINPGILRDLVANLLTYQLRQAGRIDAVYQRTPAAEDPPEIPARSLKGLIPVEEEA